MDRGPFTNQPAGSVWVVSARGGRREERGGEGALLGGKKGEGEGGARVALDPKVSEEVHHRLCGSDAWE